MKNNLWWIFPLLSSVIMGIAYNLNKQNAIIAVTAVAVWFISVGMIIGHIFFRG